MADAIKRDFGSYDKMIQQLSAASVGVMGSGWGWLAYDKPANRLQIVALPNQDPLLATTGIFQWKCKELFYLTWIKVK